MRFWKYQNTIGAVPGYIRVPPGTEPLTRHDAVPGSGYDPGTSRVHPGTGKTRPIVTQRDIGLVVQPFDDGLPAFGVPWLVMAEFSTEQQPQTLVLTRGRRRITIRSTATNPYVVALIAVGWNLAEAITTKEIETDD
jgi:hypothetical protein